MANKNLFKTSKKNTVVKADTVNNAGGLAYSYSDKQSLAQIAATNCFNGTFYTSAEDNLALAKEIALRLKSDPYYIAQVAIFSREKAYMKDMPAFLCVLLSELDTKLFRKVFRRVVDNGKMLRNVIQMARSGAVTGKVANMSSGKWRNAIQEWFNTRSPASLFKAYIGQNPSIRDIMRMARPKPNSPEKEALFAYFVGKEVVTSDDPNRKTQVSLNSLPEPVLSYEKYKRDKRCKVPNVDFRLLDSLGIGDKEWAKIAENAPWMMTRMNLNTFGRHNVFKDNNVSHKVSDRLQNKEEIEKAKAFPYQLYVAWREVSNNTEIPFCVKDALQNAMEIAIDNVPVINGDVQVCVDMSGSMGSPITGSSDKKSSTVQCVEVAGLIASAILRKNKGSTIWTFNHTAVKANLNPRDTVLTNTAKLSRAGGGTSISLPMVQMNKDNVKADVVIYVSDNESWLDSRYSGATALAEEWAKFKKRNPKAKLICIDLTPSNTSQINARPDVLQVGGWSDSCFDVIANFVEHGNKAEFWVKEIEKISVE